ncbi:MAG: Na+/H+ antiporter subunit E [Nitrosomonas sp.]|nr:Na+/H+ antiporter subunit E [Nitrosomonas sp.]
MKTNAQKIHNDLSDIALRVLLFTLLWMILSNGNPSSWAIGAPAILLAVIASIALIPPVPLVWSEVPAFIGFFLIRSLAGGADVAWRALHPHMPIAPDLITYPLRIPPGLPQVFMVNTISLLPGTLSVELITEMNQSSLTVHVLDRKKQIAIELESVEHRVARLFGVPLPVASQRQD